MDARSILLTATAALTLAAMPAAAQAAEAFNALKGSWSGGGSATFAGGQSEKLRCTARYSGGASNLALTLRCASSSAQINLRGDLDASGNRVTGSWTETSFGSSGSVRGSASGSGMRLRINGGMNGSLNISVAGNRQTVALASEGTLTGVRISLRRR